MISMSRGLVVRSLLAFSLGAALLGGCNSNLKTENEQLRTQNADLTTELESYQTKATEAESRKAEAEARLQAAQQEAASLRAQAAAVQVAQAPAPGPTGGSMGGGAGFDDAPRRSGRSSGSEVDRIVVAGDVLFAPGQATVSREGRRELDTIARKITSQYRGDNVRVEGYTDSDPIRKSRWGSNQALSLARAEAVEKYLVSKGVSASRISAVGRGSANPRATKAQSRRVEIVITER